MSVLVVLTVIDIIGSYLLSNNNFLKRDIIRACRGGSKTGVIGFMIIFPLIHECFYALLIPIILHRLGIYHDYSSALILCLLHVPVITILKRSHDTIHMAIYVMLFRLVVIGHGFYECIILHYFYNCLGIFWLYMWLRMDPRKPLQAPQWHLQPLGPVRAH